MTPVEILSKDICLDFNYKIVVCLKDECQQAISYLNIERHMRNVHGYLSKEVDGIKTKIISLFGIQDCNDKVYNESPLTIPNEMQTPVAGIPIKIGYKCTRCSPQAAFYSTSKNSMAEHYSRKHGKSADSFTLGTSNYQEKFVECYVQSLSFKSKKQPCYGVHHIEGNGVDEYAKGDKNQDERKGNMSQLYSHFGSIHVKTNQNYVDIPNPFIKTLQWVELMQCRDWIVSRAIVNMNTLTSVEIPLINCVERFILDANEKLKGASYNLRELVGKDKG